jgi:UDPglucose 6-dehydrogenase
MKLNVEKIRSARTDRGLRQQDLATLAGVGLRTVVRVERDGHVPSSDRLLKIAEVLELDPSDLFVTESAA